MALAATNLTFAYRAGAPVLRGLTARFEPGSLTAVLGPNGSGKTTLLRLLLGLLAPTGGDVLLDGRRLHAMPEHERAARLAYVPQRPSVAFGFSLLDIVSLGCGPRAPAARATRAARDALASVGLLERARTPFAELSAGQQQRAVLARALAQLDSTTADPPACALLADEPTSAMDPRHALEAMDLLGRQARAGRAVVVVLHDLAAALRFADRALVLDARGAPAASGPVREALRDPVLRRVFDVEFLELSDADRAVTAFVATIPAGDR